MPAGTLLADAVRESPAAAATCVAVPVSKLPAGWSDTANRACLLDVDTKLLPQPLQYARHIAAAVHFLGRRSNSW
jgi:hypothetical protein